MDDIFVFSHTKEEHQKHVCMVFDKVSKSKYYAKLKKGELFWKEIEFFGHTVSDAGIGIVWAKADAIKQ